MGKQKESNYELLRVLATLAVITIHVSGSYIESVSNIAWLGELYTDNMFINCVYNSLSRFAVPCFVMLSGAFALDNEKNWDFKYYYGKIFKTLGMTTFIVSTLYLLYALLQAILAILIRGRELSRLWRPIREALAGAPYYHLWYLYMMIGVFALTPVVVRLKRDVGEKVFCKTAGIFFVAAMFSFMTSSHELNWDIGKSFCYLGYYMLGYVIRKKCIVRKNNFKALLMICTGILIMLVMACCRYVWGIGMGNLDLDSRLAAPDRLVAMCASICIFTGFSLLNVRGRLNSLASITFEIYLFHARVWDILKRFVTIEMDSRLVIPISIGLVFGISIIISLIWKYLWKHVDEKYCVTPRILKRIGLE